MKYLIDNYKTNHKRCTRFLGMIFLFGLDAMRDSKGGVVLLRVLGDALADFSPVLSVAMVAVEACESILLVLWLHLVVGLSS